MIVGIVITVKVITAVVAVLVGVNRCDGDAYTLEVVIMAVVK